MCHPEMPTRLTDIDINRMWASGGGPTIPQMLANPVLDAGTAPLIAPDDLLTLGPIKGVTLGAGLIAGGLKATGEDLVTTVARDSVRAGEAGSFESLEARRLT